jgi:lipid A disaccharide synthetase
VHLLGTPRRVRAFSRAFDELMKLLPFEVEIMTVQGMKAYARRD